MKNCGFRSKKYTLYWTYLIFLIIIPGAFFSQNETQKWYFGSSAGIDFSTNPPSVLTNGVIGNAEGCSSISDGQGNILFYCDGGTVYDQTHVIMANGANLAGSNSCTQPALIIKKPGSSTLYYIFTLFELANPIGLKYSIVDMSLAAGMGSVTVKNVPLHSPSSEKICAVNHCNGTDVWVITHDWNTADFRAYLVTSAGISATPVVSTSGMIYNGSVFRTNGCMKVSPNGKKIAAAVFDGTPGSAFEVHDFDAVTGIVSNALNLGTITNAYGCEFSPDGTKIYVGRFTDHEVIQWDLCAGNPSAIVTSSYTIPTDSSPIGALQVASDGKIYIARWSTYLSTINSPNLAGSACNFVDVGIPLSPVNCELGLPNFISSSFKQAHVYTPILASVNCQTASFSAPLPNGCSNASEQIMNMHWDFNEPSSLSNNTSTLSSPVHTYSAIGTYTVKLILNYNCSSDTLMTVITITTVPTMSITGTFTICAGDKKIFTANGSSSYNWSTGAVTQTVALSPSVTTTYSVSGASINSCPNNKIFTVVVNKCTGIEKEITDQESLRIYPNPSNGLLHVQTTKPIKLIIFNSLGAKLSESFFEEGDLIINIKEYAAGIYLMKITDDSRTKTIRLVKTD